MAVHLNTLVGDRITTLRPLLEHYIRLGVDNILLHVQALVDSDPIIEQVQSIASDFGVSVASVEIGDWQAVIPGIYHRSRSQYPDDWHITADQDELQVYPFSLPDTITLCEESGFDFVLGCFLDRFSRTGQMIPVDPNTSIWEQFPVAAFVSHPLAGAEPRKVALARGNIELTKGQHTALSGFACPVERCLVQVHHFKWTDGLLAALTKRYQLLKEQGYFWASESLAIVEHLELNNGRMNLADERFLASEEAEYPYWPQVQAWLLLRDELIKLRRSLGNGPRATQTALRRLDSALRNTAILLDATM